MRKQFAICFIAGLLLLPSATQAQSIFSFSGSNSNNGTTFSFYNPLVSGSKQFNNAFVGSGPVQLSADTASVPDTTVIQYDIDSIPEQLVFYSTPCRFYLKSDSLRRLNKTTTGISYYIISGLPRGVFSSDRLGLVQYTTNKDTLDFDIRFALITSSNDTVKSKANVHFKIVPSLFFENKTFGVGGQGQLPNILDKDWQIQTVDSNYYTTSGFNFIPNQHLKTISFSAAQLILEKNSSSNTLYLLDKRTDIDTLNLYAETIIIRDGFTFPGTTVNIYAKELRFEDANGKRAFLCTTPESSLEAVINPNAGLKAGDIYLHLLKFSADVGKRFFLNGGNGQIPQPGYVIGAGGKGGNLYSNIDVRDFIVQEGGYSGNGRFDPSVPYKGSNGSFTLYNRKADWLNPNFLSVIVNYYKEGFYQGVTAPVYTSLQAYSNYINLYILDSSLYQVDTAVAVQLIQQHDEISEVLYKINNNLDFYGNPPGWVPMLSFEVSQIAYTNEVNHALNVLFLDHLIQNTNNSLTKRAAAYERLRNETKTIVQDNTNLYNDLSINVIPDINLQITNNDSRIDQLKQELKDLDTEIAGKAQKEYDERHSWSIVGTIATVCSFIPTPYTQAVGAVAGLASNFLSNNRKKGFQQGAALANQFKQSIVPFTSGSIFGDVSNLASQLYNGADTIFTKIANMHSFDDAKKIGEYANRLYNRNQGTIERVSKSISSVVDLYNKVTAVSSDEMGSIKGEMMANDPRFSLVTEKITSVQQDQQRLAQQLETSTQEMIKAQTTAYSGLTAITNFNNTIFNLSSAIDHSLSVMSYDLRRKAFERLRKYHYFLRKAYEYRTLLPYTGNLNLNSIVNKIDALYQSGKTYLDASDYDLTVQTSLASVYNEEIQQIAEDIYTYYNANRPANTIKATYALSKDEVMVLNQNKPITVNFVQAGLFPPSEEDIRIVGLKVSKIKLSVDDGTQNGSFNYVDVKMDYPNYSKIKKKGMVYSFNNYSSATEYPISWKTRYDLLTQTITPSQLSGSANSLLYTLLTGTPGATNDFVLYSRPSAWADVSITKEQTTNGTAIAKIDSVYFEIEYDYLSKPNNLVNVELNTTNKWFSPTFNISATDKYQRRAGIGNVHRAYDLAAASFITAEAPKTYGRYVFQQWVDRYGNNLVINSSVDTSGGNKIRFSLSTDRSFKAKYKFTGAVLDIPDTVYLDQNLQYSLHLQNTGAGVLNWSLDSLAPWIRYTGSRTGINDTTINLTFDQNPGTASNRIGIVDVAATETESLHHYIYFVEAKRTGPRQYIFIGNGYWDNPDNWTNRAIPPGNVTDSAEVIIDPVPNGECILNVPQYFKTGTKIKIQAGKKFRVLGGVIIQ